MDKYYINIRNLLIDGEAYNKVNDYSKNRYNLNIYYEVGKELANAGKHYGEGVIKQYSVKLTQELGKKYSASTLKYMRQFYFLIEKGAPVAHQMTWSNICELLPIKDINKINYYIKICNERNLSKRKLREAIKNKEYERLDDKTNGDLEEEFFEKVLKHYILKDMDNFLKELGEGFSYIESEYKIKIGDRYNYIDLLLYNFKYNCFAVIGASG